MPFFDTRDGTRLAYEDYGSGPPVVLVAGWVLNAGMWEYQVPCFLERGYRCVLPDRRGHGRSDRPPGGYDIDTRADDLAALIEHLDLREVTLVAHHRPGAYHPRCRRPVRTDRPDRSAHRETRPWLRLQRVPHGGPRTLRHPCRADQRRPRGVHPRRRISRDF